MEVRHCKFDGKCLPPQSATMAEGEESAHAKLLMYRDPLLPAGVIAAVRAASAAAARDAMS